MRFSTGFGVGPLRVSQRVGPPRGIKRSPAQRERDYRERQEWKEQRRNRTAEDVQSEAIPNLIGTAWLCSVLWAMFGAFVGIGTDSNPAVMALDMVVLSWIIFGVPWLLLLLFFVSRRRKA